MVITMDEIDDVHLSSDSEDEAVVSHYPLY